MISLLAIPCCVMNLASRSDAEDSKALEITGFGALIGFIADCQVPIANSDRRHFTTQQNWQLGNRHLAMCGVSRGIVSQGHNKVFTVKMARKCLFRARFAFYQRSWYDYRVLNRFAGWNRDVVCKYDSFDCSSGADFYVVPEH